MSDCEEKLKTLMRVNKIKGEHLSFDQSCHSVEEAARAANADTKDFVKNICMVDSQGNLIVAIVKGEDRASTKRIGKLLNTERPRTATPEEIVEWSKEQMAAYKYPRIVEILETLPMTATGKILKKELRAEKGRP